MAKHGREASYVVTNRPAALEYMVEPKGRKDVKMDFAAITLAGHVVADPVLRKGKEDREYGTFSIAVNQMYGGQEIVSYYNCMVPGYMYHGMSKAGVARGSNISVSGTQVIRPYTNKAGQESLSVDLRVLDWRYVGAKKKNESDAPAAGDLSGRSGQAPSRSYAAQSGAQEFVEIRDAGDLPL